VPGVPTLPAPTVFATPSLIAAAARSWRSARDDGRPVQAALFATLDRYRCGVLAPVFASLMALYETCAGRRIRVGRFDGAPLSNDEHILVDLLDGPADGQRMTLHAAADPGLSTAMRIALRSTRIMIGLTLEPIGRPGRAKLRSGSRP